MHNRFGDDVRLRRRRLASPWTRARRPSPWPGPRTARRPSWPAAPRPQSRPIPSGARGLDDRHADPVRLQFQPQRIAEAFHGELRGVVPGAERLVDLAADGGHVDDPAPPRGTHCGKDQLRHPRQAEDIDFELPAALRQLHLLQRAEGAVAGIVHQDIDPALLPSDRGRRRLCMDPSSVTSSGRTFIPCAFSGSILSTRLAPA